MFFWDCYSVSPSVKLRNTFLISVNIETRVPTWVIKLTSRKEMLSNLKHRNKKPNDVHEGKWNGLGETPEECVTREILEESGLVIQNPCLHGLLVFTNFKGNDWYVFVYTATTFTGELIDSPEGRLEWIPDENLASLNLWESDHILFRWIEDGKFFSAKFEYDGDKMRGYKVVFHVYNKASRK